MEKRGRLFGLVVLGAFFWFLASTGEAATIDVTCPGQSLQTNGINAAASSGDTIRVSGTCIENVVVNKSVIIDGSGIPSTGTPTAEIHATDAGTPTVKITSGGVTIRNFRSIQQGQDGIVVSTTGPTIFNNTIQNNTRDGILVLSGTNPIINDNTIQTNTRNGVTVYANSFATIINNDITNNSGDGIAVTENSAARIGFSSGSETTASPNTITSNGGNGINVNQSSNARIVGNTISDNTGFGIRVYQLSHAQISSNTIDNNGTITASSGIWLSGGCGVELGSASGSSIFELPNNTAVNNGGFGINFGAGAYVTGRIGTLNGVNGPIGNSNIGITISTLAGDSGIDVNGNMNITGTIIIR